MTYYLSHTYLNVTEYGGVFSARARLVVNVMEWIDCHRDRLKVKKIFSDNELTLSLDYIILVPRKRKWAYILC